MRGGIGVSVQRTGANMGQADEDRRGRFALAPAAATLVPRGDFPIGRLRQFHGSLLGLGRREME